VSDGTLNDTTRQPEASLSINRSAKIPLSLIKDTSKPSYLRRNQNLVYTTFCSAARQTKGRALSIKKQIGRAYRPGSMSKV
jgi:hypothetical protein